MFVSYFPFFLHMVIESSWALWKMSLKGCQFCTAPLYLRAVPGGSHPLIPSATESALLKLGILTLFFTWSISIVIVNSTRAWLLQLSLPLSLTYLISSSMLAGSRSNNACPLVVLSVTWIKKLSPLRSWTARVSWIIYSLLCCFSSRCQGDWSPPAGSEPANMTSPVAEERTHYQLIITLMR